MEQIGRITMRCLFAFYDNIEEFIEHLFSQMPVSMMSFKLMGETGILYWTSQNLPIIMKNAQPEFCCCIILSQEIFSD